MSSDGVLLRAVSKNSGRCMRMSSRPHHVRAFDAGRILEQDMAIFDKTLAVNYCGVVHTVKAAVPGMVARREGQVVIIASVMAIIGVSSEVKPRRLPYSWTITRPLEAFPSIHLQSNCVLPLQVLRGTGRMLRPSGPCEVLPIACGTRYA